MTAPLDWKKYSSWQEATLSNPDGSVGVRFSMQDRPTCYRRGRYLLLIEVMSGAYHEAWGCFDYQDQPMRNYHSLKRAKEEAQAIADVLVNDFQGTGVTRMKP